MDYRKAYHAARMIAESRLRLEEDETVVTFIGMMFPELRESEDEVIRKEICEFLCDGIWHDAIITQVKNTQKYCRWLDWLEKQKGQQIKWKRAKSGERFPSEALVFYEGDDEPRLCKCAVKDCRYILVADLDKKEG